MPSSPTILEPAASLPIAADVDVCVVGGSCTGVFAAVRAAQAGLRVALVEANGFFGGVATAGLVNVWHSLFDTTGEKRILGGLTQTIIDRLQTRDAVRLRDPKDESVYAYFNAAELTLELDRLVMEHPGIRPFLHARFSRPILDDPGHATHAVIEDKSGRRAIRAAVFIDATGDGDLLHRAGLPVRKPERLQPPTLCAVFAGLEDVQRRHPGFSLQDVFDPARGGGFQHVFQWSAPIIGVPGLRFAAATRVQGADSSDADSLTAAEMEGRRQVRTICDVVNREFPNDGAFRLAFLPATIGLRESRHAVATYQLTEADVLNGRRFDDAIACGSYRVDVHHGAGITFKYLNGRTLNMLVDSASGRPRWEEGRWRPAAAESPTFYQIPYRSLLPQGARNILCAGRLVDADEGSYGAVRVMVNCNQTGEAAGAAAALAVAAGQDVAQVAAAGVRAALGLADDATPRG
jgi:2-polyprenyl-6-methoxyphenol hydroxylase-like FAD-dependent oxidoreductase